MKKVLLLFLLLVVIGGAAVVYWAAFMPNVNPAFKGGIKIPTGSTYEDVLRILEDKKVLKSTESFDVISKMKKYPGKIKPGYYTFSKNLNNRQIVNILRAGLQTPVELVIYNVRTKEDFSGLVGRTLELDSNELLAKLNSKEFCKEFGLDTATILTHFITDNYELYWNTSLDNFIGKMNDTYEDFWNDARRAEAKRWGLTPSEATTLASIVEKEVIFDKEMPTVAGVYLNRIKKGMPLQADPTLVFALHDFTARRVTSYHKDFDSPYNTYMYAGLPPGPVCMPRKKSIDAVLNAEEHNFLYFCANPDMSGYSIFSATYEEQQKIAAQYRKKLNAMNIH